MKKLLLILFGLATLLVISASDGDLPMNEFLTKARRSNPVATYAKLDGTLQHRRKGAESLSMPIYFGVIIHPDRTIGQLILDRDEAYLLGQAKGSGVTSITKMPASAAGDKLGYVGVRAGDLMLSFLFLKPLRELEREMISGIVPCRVFLLDDPTHKERVKVWISREHAFPFRAEFFRYGETAPFRALEAEAFTEKNSLYYVRRIRLSGPGWNTKIDFDADSADVAPLQDGKTPQIIRQITKQKK